jgi:hypothetical protein
MQFVDISFFVVNSPLMSCFASADKQVWNGMRLFGAHGVSQCLFCGSVSVIGLFIFLHLHEFGSWPVAVQNVADPLNSDSD